MYKTRTVVTGVAALAAVAALGACSNSGNEATSSSAPSSASSSVQSSTASATAHNQADMQFTRMMIPHHQQAVEMSDMILAKQGIDRGSWTWPSRSRLHRVRRSSGCRVG